MSDIYSALPIRTEGDLDEKVQTKLVDFTTPSQGATIDSDGNLHVEVHGRNPASGEEILRMSETGNVVLDGDYDATNNSVPSSVAVMAHDRNAAPGVATQNKRPTAVVGDNDKTALDVAMQDSSGNNISALNPLHVRISDTSEDEIHSYATSVAVAKDASVNLDYTASGGDFRLYQILASASGKIRVEVRYGAAGVTTHSVHFNSTANTNIMITLAKPLVIADTDIIRVRITNLESAQDVYATIIGIQD